MSVTYEQLRDWVLALPGTREVWAGRQAWRRTAPKRVVKAYDSGQ